MQKQSFTYRQHEDSFFELIELYSTKEKKIFIWSLDFYRGNRSFSFCQKWFSSFVQSYLSVSGTVDTISLLTLIERFNIIKNLHQIQNKNIYNNERWSKPNYCTIMLFTKTMSVRFFKSWILMKVPRKHLMRSARCKLFNVLFSIRCEEKFYFWSVFEASPPVNDILHKTEEGLTQRSNPYQIYHTYSHMWITPVSTLKFSHVITREF